MNLHEEVLDLIDISAVYFDIPMGSFFYDIPEVVRLLTGRCLKRGIWMEDKHISNVAKGVKTLVLADTIATGTTISKCIDILTYGFGFEKVVVYTVAATEQGIASLRETAVYLSHKYEIEFHLVYPSPLLTLGSNNVDMIASINPEVCAIGDWSQRFMEPMKHLKKLDTILQDMDPTPWVDRVQLAIAIFQSDYNLR